MNYRITYYGSEGTIYSEVENFDDECILTLGDWDAPFPNTEEESSAFGLAECLAQSDSCPSAFLSEELFRISIKDADTTDKIKVFFVDNSGDAVA